VKTITHKKKKRAVDHQGNDTTTIQFSFHGLADCFHLSRLKRL